MISDPRTMNKDRLSVYRILAKELVESIKKYNPLFQGSFLTTSSSLDASIIEPYKKILHKHQALILEKLPTSLKEFPHFLWYFFISLIQSCIFLYQVKPDILFSTGGIVALPSTLAAYIMNIPIHFYELNTLPGKAIEILAPLAAKIYCPFHIKSFDKIEKPLLYLPYPIRYRKEEIEISSEKARVNLGLDPSKYTLTILGGSQGSASLNQMIMNLIENKQILPNTMQCIHQTGKKNLDILQDIYKKHGIEAYVFSYAHDLSSMYAAADIIIARAGAGTIFECKAFGKETLLLPLETSTTDHQKYNALHVSKKFPNLFSIVMGNDEKVIERINVKNRIVTL
jgi:UDP-N-acetylglucosamine--N-acetylmuramyl-(pentapeptide) pyrophosphoryl-undecaprenol N-acetylglucosamine transferase